jgi:hypothetical protein
MNCSDLRPSQSLLRCGESGAFVVPFTRQSPD